MNFLAFRSLLAASCCFATAALAAPILPAITGIGTDWNIVGPIVLAAILVCVALLFLASYIYGLRGVWLVIPPLLVPLGLVIWTVVAISIACSHGPTSCL